MTPSFNHGEYLDAAMRSVLEQDHPGLTYFVADGGSTDNSVEILRKHSTDPRLQWISQPDKGQADAINTGFSRTNGEILGWLNSDDTYLPGTIAKIAAFFAAFPEVGCVYGDAQFIDSAGNVIGPCQHIERFNRQRLLHYSDYLVQPATFFRRTIFNSVGGLDPTLNWAMDYDLWLKLSAQTQVVYLPGLLANYRWLGSSKTAGGGAKRLEEVESVVRRHGANGMPAFFRLEAVRMHLADAIDQGDVAESIKQRGEWHRLPVRCLSRRERCAAWFRRRRGGSFGWGRCCGGMSNGCTLGKLIEPARRRGRRGRKYAKNQFKILRYFLRYFFAYSPTLRLRRLGGSIRISSPLLPRSQHVARLDSAVGDGR